MFQTGPVWNYEVFQTGPVAVGMSPDTRPQYLGVSWPLFDTPLSHPLRPTDSSSHHVSTNTGVRWCHRCQLVSPVSAGVTGVRCPPGLRSRTPGRYRAVAACFLSALCIRCRSFPRLPVPVCVCVISAHGGVSVAIARGPPPGRGVDFSGSGQEWQRWSRPTGRGISCPASRDGSAVGGGWGGVA